MNRGPCNPSSVGERQCPPSPSSAPGLRPATSEGTREMRLPQLVSLGRHPSHPTRGRRGCVRAWFRLVFSPPVRHFPHLSSHLHAQKQSPSRSTITGRQRSSGGRRRSCGGRLRCSTSRPPLSVKLRSKNSLDGPSNQSAHPPFPPHAKQTQHADADAGRRDCFRAMSWRIPLFGSSQQQQQQQQPEPNFQNISTQSWYPPLVGGSSSLPSTPSSSGASPHQRASDHPQPSSRGQPSPAEAAGIIARLRDKSVDELQRLLKDKESYNAFFNSLDQVKTQNNLRDELRKETLQLARENLEKEQRISELRNQCTIIRTTELAAAEDRLAELERQKDEIMKSYSPAALLNKLQSTMAKLDEESEELHQKFLEKDVDLPTFVQKYKKLRAAHHKCVLLHLSGKASLR